MQDHIRERRRTYYIDKSFQFKFIMKFCSLIIIASLLTGILLYYFNQQTTTVAFDNLSVVVKTTADFILPIMLQILLTVALLVSVGTVAVTLFTSHKIAGPLYRLQKDLEKMKSGDYSGTIQIRAHDQLQKVATEFNEVRQGINNSLSILKKNWQVMKIRMTQLKSTMSEDEEAQLDNTINKIDAELGKYKTT